MVLSFPVIVSGLSFISLKEASIFVTMFYETYLNFLFYIGVQKWCSPSALVWSSGKIQPSHLEAVSHGLISGISELSIAG